jgi:hypothetical protein
VALSGWPEVLLYPKMQLDAARAEPGAAARSQSRRLIDLDQAQHVGVELSICGLLPAGHHQLHVV